MRDKFCHDCGTEQLRYEEHFGCLCQIIFEAQITTEERIIKLLEEDLSQLLANYGVRNLVEQSEFLPALIALVKGGINE